MGFQTDTQIVHLIRIWIPVLVDNAPLIIISYYKNMLSSKDTNNMLNVTMPA